MTNQNNTRIGQQLVVLSFMDTIIEKATKVTITPTRITIKSHLKAGSTFDAQLFLVNSMVKHHGHLPFTVELVPHG